MSQGLGLPWRREGLVLLFTGTGRIVVELRGSAYRPGHLSQTSVFLAGGIPVRKRLVLDWPHQHQHPWPPAAALEPVALAWHIPSRLYFYTVQRTASED